jgi:hypothetical protein
MRNLLTVYIEVESNKIIAKESRVSFDFEIDVWSRHPRAPCLDYRAVHNKFSLKCPGIPPYYYGMTYTTDVWSPDSIRHIVVLSTALP